MATADSVTARAFFPHLRTFVEARYPEMLADLDLARIEAGRLLPGETLCVLSLNALAEDWVRVRELLRTACHPGVLADGDLGETAWYLVRATRGGLPEAEQASLEALRAAGGGQQTGRTARLKTLRQR